MLATEQLREAMDRTREGAGGVVNLLSVDKVRGGVGCVVRGWPTWRMGKRVWLCLINQEHCTTTPNQSLHLRLTNNTLTPACRTDAPL